MSEFIPRTIRRTTVSKPVEVDEVSIRIPYDEARLIVLAAIADKLVGPEGFRVPPDAEISFCECGTCDDLRITWGVPVVNAEAKP